MAARTSFKISDDVRDVLARSTDRDPREALGLAVETGEAVNSKAKLQAFYTPKLLAESVAAKAKLKHGHRVLEPSMGAGALVLAAARVAAVRINAVDLDAGLADKIAAIRATASDTGSDVLVQLGVDFLTVEPDVQPRYDAVLMNPPFQNGQDMQHVAHAWRFVKPGGVLVAIMWPAWQTAQTKAADSFRALVAAAATSEVEDIPRETFEDTDVATVMHAMRKPKG